MRTAQHLFCCWLIKGGAFQLLKHSLSRTLCVLPCHTLCFDDADDAFLACVKSYKPL